MPAAPCSRPEQGADALPGWPHQVAAEELWGAGGGLFYILY